MKLTTAARRRIPAADFALPPGRFPIEDRAHQLAAVRLAPRAEHAGNITAAQEHMIVRKAEARLEHHDRKPDGRKGKKDKKKKKMTASELRDDHLRHNPFLSPEMRRGGRADNPYLGE